MPGRGHLDSEVIEMNSDEKQTQKATKEANPNLGDSGTLVEVDSPDDFSYEGQFGSEHTSEADQTSKGLQASMADQTFTGAQTTNASLAMNGVSAKKRTESLRHQSGNKTR